MPYKSEKIPIEGTSLDSRRKLSPKQHEAIRLLHEKGYSYRDLADMFGCSKSNVQHIVRPTHRSKPKPHPKEYWTARKREYRRRKQQLYKDGKLNKLKNNKFK